MSVTSSLKCWAVRMAVIDFRLEIWTMVVTLRIVTIAIALFSLVLAGFTSQPTTASGDSLATNKQGDAPTVSISYAEPSDVHRVRINSPISLLASFSEPVYGFAIEDIRLVNGLATDFSGGDGDTSYTFRATPNAIGAVTVDIAAGVAEDVARNATTAASQFSLGIPYDDDHDGGISREEVVGAIRDYFHDSIDRQHVIAILRLYFSSVPDLVVDTPTIAGGRLAAGASFTLHAAVSNLGNGQSNSTTLRYYRSADINITTNDTEVGAASVGGLAALGSSAQSISLTAPSTAGTYYYGACVDAVSRESDTANNCSVALTVTVSASGPDLVIPFVLLVGNPTGADGNGTIATSFTISSVVRNSGDKPSKSIILRVYRSTDTTITNNDTEVASLGVSGLAASWARSYSFSLTAPSAAGAFYYGVCVDPVPSEIDVENNCSSSQTLNSSTNSERDLYQYLITSMNLLGSADPESFGRLTGQPWFNNGLAEDKMALIVTMPSISRDLRKDLIEAHYVRAKTVSLSLAGNVNIWVLQNTPFPQDEDLATIIEDTARMIEDLLDVSFPTTDVILLVVDRSETHYRVYEAHYDTHMLLARYDGKVRVIPHETAHYYFFAPFTGPRWLTEGAAELMAAHYNHLTGHENLDRARSTAAWLTQGICFDRSQIENIRHLMYIVPNDWDFSRSESCIYQLGENFLYNAEKIMGQAAVMSVLGDLHVAMLGKESQNIEEKIYDVFLKNVPIDRREDFREMYQKLHGGAAAFPATDYSDDHGDEAAVATEVEVRQVVHGNLDYMFDFDYFRFQSEEDQTYRIQISHSTLRLTGVGLYGPDGLTGENHHWKSRDAALNGPRIIWTAQNSGEYFVAVHNFGSKAGSYTLTITPVVKSALDDYGDTVTTATKISIGEAVNGTVNNHFDIDYFEFQVEADQTYLLEIEGGTLKEFRFRLRTPNARSYRFTAADEFLHYPDGFWFTWKRRLPFRWTGKVLGEAYLAIDGVDERVGTYSLKVIPYEK